MGLYFSYGSNLNKEQMLKRCPKAVPLEKIHIKDFKLVFRGVADIIRSDGSYLDGGLWKITDQCEEALDIYEGVDSFLYSKMYFNWKGEEVLVYTMNERGILPPGDYYAYIIRQGFTDFGIPTDSLDAAINESWQHKNPTSYLKARRSQERRKGVKREKRIIAAE